MNRFTLLYLSLCLFYTGELTWLEAPEVGFFETEFEIQGVLDGAIAWVLFCLVFLYAVSAAIRYTRILHHLHDRGASRFRLTMLSAAGVFFAGSLGIVLYLLTGNPYTALPFDALMLLLTPYYYWHLSRLLSPPATDGSTP